MLLGGLRWAQTSWSMVGLTLLLILGLEMSLRVFWQPSTTSAAAPPEEVAPDWAADYSREFQASYRAQWEPYVYWRREAYEGEHVRITADGLRATWTDPSLTDTEQTYTIAVFGGSTVWGTGARNDFTIPSLLAKKLAEAGEFRVRVVNFGESGYVSTQELVALIREIQGGHVPHVAVFYDGVNDTFSALQNGQAGLPENESNRYEEFGASRSGGRLARLLLRVAPRVSRLGQSLQGATLGTPPVEASAIKAGLAASTVETYKANLELLGALRGAYEFELVCYWQPVVFSRVTQVPAEQSLQEDNASLRPFYDEVYAQIKASPPILQDATFRDLSDCLSQDPAQRYYVDYCHLNEAGNDVVATAMLPDIVTALRRIRAEAQQQPRPVPARWKSF